MRIHAHDPVRRIDPIVAAARTHVGVTRKTPPCSSACHLQKHPHVSVHGRGIGNQCLPELSRFIGSAMFTTNCIFISCSCSACSGIAMPFAIVRCVFAWHLMRGVFAFRLRCSLSERVSFRISDIARFRADDLRMHRTSVELLRAVVFVLAERDACDGHAPRHLAN